MRTFCSGCKRKTDNNSKTYVNPGMKIIRVFCIECGRDKNQDTVFHHSVEIKKLRSPPKF